MKKARGRLIVGVIFFLTTFATLCFAGSCLFYRISSEGQTQITCFDGVTITWSNSIPDAAYHVEAALSLSGNWSTNLPVSELSATNGYTSVSLISTNWQPGVVLVDFPNTTPIENIAQFFNSYDLTFSDLSPTRRTYKAFVLPGTELMWIDIFTTNAIVEYAEPNYGGTTASNPLADRMQ